MLLALAKLMLGTCQKSIQRAGDRRRQIVAGKKSTTSQQRSAKRSKGRDAGARRAPQSGRIGRESSKTRSDLLDAAETLMRKEGYAAVTSRKVANRAKLTP